MTLTKLPSAPNRDDPKEVFIQKMDNFVKALPSCIEELQVYIENSKTETDTKLAIILNTLNVIQSLHQEVQKAQVSTKQIQVVASQGVIEEWKSGFAYKKGDHCYSPVNLRVYKARQAVQSSEDPSTNTSWVSATLHTGLFIEKVYTPCVLKADTHWLILKEGEYTLPLTEVNSSIKLTNNTSSTCTFTKTNIRGTETVLELLSGESRTLQYSGETYGWI